MKKLIVVFFFCLFAQQFFACEYNLLLSLQHQRPFGFGTKTIHSPAWCPLGECRSEVLKMIYTPFHMFNPERFGSRMMVSSYNGLPFSESAVFCRMENHFLTRYSVKFSIHAGGYRELGSTY